MTPLFPCRGRPAVLGRTEPRPSVPRDRTPGTTLDTDFTPFLVVCRGCDYNPVVFKGRAGDWLVSCALSALTIAGDSLTIEQFFSLHNSKLIGGEARTQSNKYVLSC